VVGDCDPRREMDTAPYGAVRIAPHRTINKEGNELEQSEKEQYLNRVELRSWCIEQVLSKTSMSAKDAVDWPSIVDNAACVEAYVMGRKEGAE
jgi:hypothetical protein